VLFKEVNKHLEKNGLMLREGNIVDVTIISAPNSTKSSTGKRDRIVGPPKMHQPRKGKEWHFGMKMHIGVDDTLGLIHSIDTTAANVHEIVPTDKLLHGEEQRVFGDAGYLGILNSGTSRSTRKRLDTDKLKAEKIKTIVRDKVEHPLRNIKQCSSYSKFRYRGLAKNSNRLHLLAAFSNLLQGEKYLLA
jgi:IS5 family transposase